MKIIIIGNGYDLNLELSSRFSDFYSKYYQNKNGEWNYNKIRGNIWLLLLYFKYIEGCRNGLVHLDKDSPRWMDVEGFICEILNNDEIISLMNTSFQEKTHYVQPDGIINGDTVKTQINEIKSLIQMNKNN